jgi:hypothetical protein
MATGVPDKHPGGGTTVWKSGNVPGNPVADSPQTAVRGPVTDDKQESGETGHKVSPPEGACH